MARVYREVVYVIMNASFVLKLLIWHQQAFTGSTVKGWTIVPSLQTPIFTMGWDTRLAVLQNSNQVYRPGPNICYFESIHWSLPLSYRNWRTQPGISDVQICWSHGWLAHTALREVLIVLPSCSPDVPKPQSPNPQKDFSHYNKSLLWKRDKIKI